jgi:hypothetical protein
MNGITTNYCTLRPLLCSTMRSSNQVKAGPMNIPLTKAIYEENRETVLYG